MLFKDTPKNRITNPIEYLRGRYPGKSFEMVFMLSLADKVPSYYIRETNACALYGIASLLAFHVNESGKERGEWAVPDPKGSGSDVNHPFARGAEEAVHPAAINHRPLPKVSATAESLTPRVIRLFSEKLHKAAVPRDFTLRNIHYNSFSRHCIQSLKLPLSASSSFSCRSKGMKELQAGRPFLLNIWYADAGGYFNHSVACCGMAEYRMQGSKKRFCFYQIRDGYTKDTAPRWTMLGHNPIQAYVTVFTKKDAQQ